MICLLLLLLVLISCSTTNADHPIPIEEGLLNNQILIRAPGYSNSFKTTEPLNLELKYYSNNEIVFQNNYNLRIFQFISSKWIEIKEKPTERFPIGEVIFSPNKYMPAVEVVTLFPDLPDFNKEYQLRIYVTGVMKTNVENKDVSAYVDVMLTR
jgi:hypothetical protein